MNYEQALEYIHDTRWRGSRRTLDRIKLMLEKMGNPQNKLKAVHIAGTNGKGSTSACIAEILMKAGYKVGLYTSPFIKRYNERMRINGRQIPDDTLSMLTDELSKIADSLPEHPTEFEFGTAVAFEYFYREKCDIVVLEAGMGGETDATNAIERSEVSVFAAIGLDHMQYLGPTIRDIARTKSGIIKENGTVCSYVQEKDAAEELEKKCKEMNARIHYADFSEIKNTVYSLDGTEFDYKNMHIKLALPGTYQPYNAAVAIDTVLLLRDKGWKITDENILDGLRNVYWPGRFEVLSQSPVFILDGAHNGHGIKAAADSLKEMFGNNKIIFVLGVMADKDIDDMLPLIAPLAKEVVTLTPHNPRAMDSEVLARKIEEYGVPATGYTDIDSGVAEAVRRAGDTGIICALGSLYFSDDVKNAAKRALVN